MKTIVSMLTLSLLAVFSTASFAQSQPEQGLTRAQVQQELKNYEANGYYPARMNPQSYVNDVQKAQQKVSQSH